MKIEKSSNNAVYVTIRDKVFYIDYSIKDDEPFIDSWDLVE